MRSRTLVALIVLLAGGMTGSSPTETTAAAGSALDRAEALYAEGSYRMAHDLYAGIDTTGLSLGEARWIEFRLADTRWRSRAASSVADPTVIRDARARLESLIRDAGRQEERDRVWAEVQESLGDLFWARPDSRDWGQAWPRYREALEWWGGSRDLDLARARYLALVRKAALPPATRPYYSYGYFGNQLPLEIVQNALKIAVEPEDRAHASYLMAMTLRHARAGRDTHPGIRDAFETAVELGRGTAWYDDALFQFAEWMNGQGRVERLEDGGYRYEPDHVGALELYNRLVNEFREGETRHYRTAKNRIETINSPSVGVAVSRAFLPGASVEYHLTWRNVASIDLALHRVDLVRDVRMSPDRSGRQWLDSISLEAADPLRTWKRSTDDRGLHLPGRESVLMDGELPPGAYVLRVSAGGRDARALILVTGTALTLKPAANRSLAYVCDALDGSPRGGALLAVWERNRRGRREPWRRTEVRAGEDGVAVLELPHRGDREFFVAAASGDHQAFAMAGNWRARHPGEIWKVYAFSDRPAYRPDEEVRWKLIARIHDGSGYSTPAGRELHYALRDPLGNEVDGGQVTLNEFGAAWGDLRLGKDLRLGEYSMSLEDPAKGRTLGIANLFRLEEYRLPEFRVEIGTSTEDGRSRAYRVGDTAEAEVRAEYYFGGPVTGASVEAVVYRRLVHVRYRPPRDFPWFHEDHRSERRYRRGPGEIVHRETLKTDHTGRAVVRFDTGQYPAGDMEFTVEARVTDISRRENTGSGSIRAGTKPYYLFATVEHYLYRPGDRVDVDFRAVDINENPVQAEGTVRVTRDAWREIWIDPFGRKVAGEDLERARLENKVFPPPPPRPGGPSWRLDFEGYQREEILNRLVRTGADGEAALEFTPSASGYYRIEWTGAGDELPPVRSEATVWVTDRDTTAPGYRPGGVEIVLDRDTFRAGETAPLMLTAPVSGAWILFTVEGDALYEHRLVHLAGSSRLLNLRIEERHVPNVFLEAAMVRDAELYLDVKDVVVPPVRHFLQVEVEADRREYLPGSEGTVTVTTRDHDGRPVSAEVSLGVTDESVYAIQGDYAGDPRQYFFGTRRTARTETTSTFRHLRYAARERRDVTEMETESDRLRSLGYVEGGEKVLRAKPAAPFEESAAEGFTEGTADSEVIRVRTDFRSTALWRPDVVTGEDGKAAVKVRFPESLTSWRATARAATTGARFGIGRAEARTNLPLMCRLQTPRFFVAGDTAVVSAVLNNNTSSPMAVKAGLETEGIELLGGPAADTVAIPAGGEIRVDWRVQAAEAGRARFRVIASGGEYGDAMERSCPVHEHGVERFLARSGKVRGEDALVTMEIPRERRPGSATLEVRVTPSLALTMLDALPYLIDYPYGCTEQTMSRFLPTVIAVRTLDRLGLDPEDVTGRVFGGIEEPPEGGRNLDRMDEMVRAGLDRLRDFQRDDGGWGWWKEGDGDPFMTAYVLWGLAVADEAGVGIDPEMAKRAAGYLNRTIVDSENEPDMQAWILHALTSARRFTGSVPGNRHHRTAYENLWKHREHLNAYARALLALSARHLGDEERAGILARNLANGVILDRSTGDDAVGTAHWGSDGIAWRWSRGGVEATAFALRALLAVDPEHELVEPAMNWLVRNRRGARWSNTRDTAIVVLALTDYLDAAGEVTAEVDYAVTFNGRELGFGRVTPDGILSAACRFPVDRSWIRDGANEIRFLRRSGSGPIYFSVEAAYFSLEEPVPAAGNEIFLRREYLRKVPHPTLLQGFDYDLVPLRDGDAVASGERIEVVLTVEAKNHYEYLVFEDLKPAGLEAVLLHSGGPAHARELTAAAAERDAASRDPEDYTGRSRYAYRELRDRKVVMFLDKLPEGAWELRYEMRAETPGRFHALPTLGHAMYVPEIRCNGDEIRIGVGERAD
jgi:uncharacterized protein YfaS (alpha-2-macroglobulin family)